MRAPGNIRRLLPDTASTEHRHYSIDYTRFLASGLVELNLGAAETPIIVTVLNCHVCSLRRISELDYQVRIYPLQSLMAGFYINQS
jgi:hypothetical protein